MARFLCLLPALIFLKVSVAPPEEPPGLRRHQAVVVESDYDEQQEIHLKIGDVLEIAPHLWTHRERNRYRYEVRFKEREKSKEEEISPYLKVIGQIEPWLSPGRLDSSVRVFFKAYRHGSVIVRLKPINDKGEKIDRFQTRSYKIVIPPPPP